MAIGHGKKAYLALDDLAGALTSVKAAGDSITFTINADQPDTPVYGDRSATRELLGQRRASISFAGYVKGAVAASTAKVHGKATRVLLNEFAVSGELQTGTVSRSAPLVNSEGYGDDWDERDIKGMLDASFTFGGPYNGATGKIDAILNAIQASETRGILSYAPAGFGVGNLVDMGSIALTDRPINSPISDKAMVSVTAPVNGEADLGVSLHDTTAETTTFDGTAVDETAATANGGVGHLHCTTFSGTNGTWKIQDSSDNSSWTDLITFASVTAVGSQRIELAAGAAVKRYVRVICSTDNFTSAIVQVSFARRDFAYGTAGTHRHFCGLLAKDNATTSFSYGPLGNDTGSPNFTGECMVSSYSVTYSHNAPSKFTLEAQSSGTITSGTY